mgnify:CR=1 FL=1
MTAGAIGIATEFAGNAANGILEKSDPPATWINVGKPRCFLWQAGEIARVASPFSIDDFRRVFFQIMGNGLYPDS